jgi:hypothetical protein
LKKIILLLIFVLQSFNTYAYDNEIVHQLINESAAMQSVNFSSTMNQLGFKGALPSEIIELNIVNNRTIKYWLREGAKLEDVPNCRSKYHFHDPTKSFDAAGLSNAAINTVCTNWSNYSSVKWAQHQNNEWSWQKARNYFYLALTSTTNTDRETNFAKTFQAVGQVMHLLADASVPEHTRNDIHILPFFDNATQSFPQIGSWTYETWSKHHASELNTTAVAVDPTIANTPVASGVIPISNFWDTTPGAGYGGTLGLAEYSNANFLSSDTIFRDYAYPAKPMHHFERFRAEDGQYDSRVYFSGITSDSIPINHLASTGFLWADLETISPFSMDTAQFDLDDNCFKDYANILVPKAVGYNAALLNYFFRGEIEISLPDVGAYATASEGSSFQQIRLKARNTTKTDEEMTTGTLQVVVKYKLAQSDPFMPPFLVTTSEEFSYAVSPPISVSSIPKETATEFTFDLSQSPVPVWATDVYLQVVFKGKLGNEEEAVAIGFKDISEPTAYDIINYMHRICANGKWIDAGSPEAIAVTRGIDYAAHRMTNIYMVFSPQVASPTHFAIVIPEISPSSSARTFILSDQTTDVSFYYSVPYEEGDMRLGPGDSIQYREGVNGIPTMKNQTDLIEGVANRTYSILLPWHGQWRWASYTIESSTRYGDECDPGL